MNVFSQSKIAFILMELPYNFENFIIYHFIYVQSFT